VERFGIKIAVAERGRVRREVRVPGEIRVNADRVAHVVPRAAGVVREAVATLGDTIDAGAVLAWIESDELAASKLDYYAKESEVACCEIELPRAKAIYENVAKLIGLLRAKNEPTEKAIGKLDDLEMGAYRGQLLTAHAAYRAAQAVMDRESRLRGKEISSGQDLLTAETALKQAKAALLAALDTARYETLIAYTEAARERQVALFEAAAAEKTLRLKGADDSVISSLRALVPRTARAEPCLCDNPNCKEGELPSVGEALNKKKRFAWYALRSPFRGTVIKKHIARGESLDDSSEVFAIADLSSVWVDLAISQEAAPAVREGQSVTIRLPDGASAEAQIGFVAPTIDPETRTALGRVVLKNERGNFRPGTFVEATVWSASKRDAIVIPKASVQLVDDHSCVFVWKAGAFELREVVTGTADGTRIEIVRGLTAGEKVAAVNAFHLKAEFIKSAAGDLGAHHGHSH
jgi:multidrug efflux pump subunit AcrA (membrane-fusion protein)